MGFHGVLFPKLLLAKAILIVLKLTASCLAAGDKQNEKCMYLLYLDAISVVNKKRSAEKGSDAHPIIRWEPCSSFEEASKEWSNPLVESIAESFAYRGNQRNGALPALESFAMRELDFIAKFTEARVILNTNNLLTSFEFQARGM